jgi:hypothetical protein
VRCGELVVGEVGKIMTVSVTRRAPWLGGILFLAAGALLLRLALAEELEVAEESLLRARCFCGGADRAWCCGGG